MQEKLSASHKDGCFFGLISHPIIHCGTIDRLPVHGHVKGGVTIHEGNVLYNLSWNFVVQNVVHHIHFSQQRGSFM